MLSTYAYDIEMTYIDKKEQINIKTQSITMLAIDHDYDNANQPMILINFSPEISLYNKMVMNKQTAKIFLNVKIYEEGKKNPIKKDYIKEQFSYFLADDQVELDIDLIKQSNTENTAYKPTVIGLLKSNLIDEDNIIINNLFFNTNTMTIIHYYTNKMKMVIEPLDYNNSHNTLLVPPMSGISKFIRYLNEKVGLYKSNYRYYMDFDKTYLLSTKGKEIDIKDGTFSTIKITIVNNIANTKEKGIEKDTKSKIYLLEIDSKYFTPYTNKTTEKRFNGFYTIDSSGNKNISKLDIYKEDTSSDKYTIIKQYGTNSNFIEYLKSTIENSSVGITILKADLDTSLIVPYKGYRIENLKEYKHLDGEYILSRKKEYILPSDGHFRCTLEMQFKKIS